MKYLFLSSIILFMEYNIKLGSGMLSLFPYCVAYVLLLKGLEQLFPKEKLYIKAKPYIQILQLITTIGFYLEMFGVIKQQSTLFFTISLTLLLINLIIMFFIVKTIVDAEGTTLPIINAKFISISFKLLIITCVTRYIYIFEPLLQIPGMIINILGVALFAASLFNAMMTIKKGTKKE